VFLARTIGAFPEYLSHREPANVGVMKNALTNIVLPALASLAGFCSPALAAGSATGQFNVTATVLAACSVSATDLIFGSYSASTATPTDISNSMSITCTNALPYTVALDGGTTAASVAARTMTDSATPTAHLLKYFLYSNSSRTTLWGDGTSGTSTIGGTGTGATATLNVYGRIPAGQFLNAGSYSDKITITISY
jgi:spore coat protein U-like protein